MKPNIGRIDALIRITAGFTVLAYSIAKMVRKPHRNRSLLAAMLGGMKVAEGITRFCPLVYLAKSEMMHPGHGQLEEDHHQDGRVMNPS
ncbi:hypothetical protein AB685_21795 [Bacillus sp. LL01]|uniref:YgaP family membrane protein n=1 Tax=Bacillus sp. LL01 TaxID=1665556 RepID=UPI00064D1D52|nr:DUF2892 domain-containing protein [Bacillus sp. LL01]KMJ56455.1 hypothetical protein AB685_21795 [Bacillus sp. LL01]